MHIEHNINKADKLTHAPGSQEQDEGEDDGARRGDLSAKWTSQRGGGAARLVRSSRRRIPTDPARSTPKSLSKNRTRS